MNTEKSLLDTLPSIDISRLVVFCIRMEGNEGILGKAPDYIKEKLEEVLTSNCPRRFLDGANTRKYIEWLLRWHNHLPREWLVNELNDVQKENEEVRQFLAKMKEDDID